MSRQPSPAVVSSSASNGGGTSHIFHQTTGANMSSSAQPHRQKSRAYASGIAAGAEDVKYAAKYRELKKKVKEIESDNDKLLLKVLTAKRSVQRAKLERAVIYERLLAINQASQPPRGNTGVPSEHVHGSTGPSKAHHPHDAHAAHGTSFPIISIETRHGPMQVLAGPDGRPVVGPDGRFIQPMIPTMATVVGDSVGPFNVQNEPPVEEQEYHSKEPSSSSRSGRHSRYYEPPSRQHSSSSRHLEPPQPHSYMQEPGPSGSKPRSRSSQAQATTTRPHRTRGGRERERERQREHERDWELQQQHLAQQAALIEGQAGTSERPSRRLEMIELSGNDGGHSAYAEPRFVQGASQHRIVEISPPSPPPMHEPIDERPIRIHNHQRVGPGANINQRDPMASSMSARIPTPPFARSAERDQDGGLSRNIYAQSGGTRVPSRPGSRAAVHEHGHGYIPDRESRRAVGSRLSDLVNLEPPEPFGRAHVRGPLEPAVDPSSRNWNAGPSDMDVDGEPVSRRVPDSDDEDEPDVAAADRGEYPGVGGPGYLSSASARAAGYEPEELASISGSSADRGGKRVHAERESRGQLPPSAPLHQLPPSPAGDHALDDAVQYQSVGEMSSTTVADRSGGGPDAPIKGSRMSASSSHRSSSMSPPQ